MTDVLSIPLPETHIWAVVFCWVAAYIGGRFLGGGFS